MSQAAAKQKQTFKGRKLFDRDEKGVCREVNAGAPHCFLSPPKNNFATVESFQSLVGKIFTL
ncbi:hypothetical protein H2C83_00770 [Thermoactinomyces sp. AMNI-1]|uniref:Uncharacterized protein n=2 Tax=Thermoactinomyces mirandus TaxID=2756294 RepID=A0A7W1XPG6_9BACL|nr:hypothetical protein [Thermoactinomyces mirandus]